MSESLSAFSILFTMGRKEYHWVRFAKDLRSAEISASKAIDEQWHGREPRAFSVSRIIDATKLSHGEVEKLMGLMVAP